MPLVSIDNHEYLPCLSTTSTSSKVIRLWVEDEWRWGFYKAILWGKFKQDSWMIHIWMIRNETCAHTPCTPVPATLYLFWSLGLRSKRVAHETHPFPMPWHTIFYFVWGVMVINNHLNHLIVQRWKIFEKSFFLFFFFFLFYLSYFIKSILLLSL